MPKCHETKEVIFSRDLIQFLTTRQNKNSTYGKWNRNGLDNTSTGVL